MDRINAGQLGGSGIAAALELTVASLSNPTELNSIGTAVPDWRLCHTTTAGADQATLYRLDASNASFNAPYVMASATAGLQWIAVCGASQHGNMALDFSFTAGGNITANGGTIAANGASASITATATAGGGSVAIVGFGTNAATLQFSNTTTGGLFSLSSSGSVLSLTDIQSSNVVPWTYAAGSLATSVFNFLNTKDATAVGTAGTVFSGGVSVNRQIRSGSTITGVGLAATTGGVTVTDGNISINNSGSAGVNINSSASSSSLMLNPASGFGAFVIGQQGGINIARFGTSSSTLAFIVQDMANGSWNPIAYTAGTSSAGYVTFAGTLSASTPLVGAVVVGNGTAATNVGIGGGNINAGGTLTTGGNIATSQSGSSTWTNTSTAGTAAIQTNGQTAGLAKFQLALAGTVQYSLTTSNGTYIQTDVVNSWNFLQYNPSTSALGTVVFNGTLNATAAAAAALVISGGASFTKNTIHAMGLGWGVTSTATAAGTTTLSATTTVCQVFTGSTTQSVTLPAANVFGAGVAYVIRIKNVSTGTVTINRAGADTIDGGTSTTLTGGSKQSVDLISDGVSAWYIT